MTAPERRSLVLASRSPRRADLLIEAGVRFSVQPADVDERTRPGEGPADLVTRLAGAKCGTIARIHPASVVIGADTVVVRQDGRVLGKPADEHEAMRMLQSLSDATHEVLTGVAVAADGGRVFAAALERTAVTFRRLSAAEVRDYVATGEPMDAAGSYQIQAGAGRFVECIDGAHDTVVGLPMMRVGALLADLGCGLDQFRASSEDSSIDDGG